MRFANRNNNSLRGAWNSLRLKNSVQHGAISISPLSTLDSLVDLSLEIKNYEFRRTLQGRNNSFHCLRRAKCRTTLRRLPSKISHALVLALKSSDNKTSRITRFLRLVRYFAH